LTIDDRTPAIRLRFGSILERFFTIELTEVGESLVDRTHAGARDPPEGVEVEQELQVVESLTVLDRWRGTRFLARLLERRKLGDQGESPEADGPSKRLDGGGHGIGQVDRLADVVQERGDEEFLVVRSSLPGQLEDLEAVIQRVAFGMPARVLLDRFERPEP
jgi:hypothetical protein